jgi:hypothetical protein
MAKKQNTPDVVSYMGHLYVVAADEEPLEDALEEMAGEEGDELPPADSELDEEMEEVEMLDALKGAWQTVLDRLPDDLEVDEEFEDALNTIEEVIKVMDEMHAEYAEPPEDEEAPAELPEPDDAPDED